MMERTVTLAPAQIDVVLWMCERDEESWLSWWIKDGMRPDDDDGLVELNACRHEQARILDAVDEVPDDADQIAIPHIRNLRGRIGEALEEEGGTLSDRPGNLPRVAALCSTLSALDAQDALTLAGVVRDLPARYRGWREGDDWCDGEVAV